MIWTTQPSRSENRRFASDVGRCVLAAWCALSVGCASFSTPVPVHHAAVGTDSTGNVAVNQFEYGKPYPVLDGAGWVLGIPNRLLLWNSRVDNHDVGPETEKQIRQYLVAHQLDDVKVRINQYAPGDEWRRLRDNDKLAGGWRYTFGALNTLAYTLLPGRLFGGDWYNPYTDTVHLYSDVPSIALYEAAYAKDVASRSTEAGMCSRRNCRGSKCGTLLSPAEKYASICVHPEMPKGCVRPTMCSSRGIARCRLPPSIRYSAVDQSTRWSLCWVHCMVMLPVAFARPACLKN